MQVIRQLPISEWETYFSPQEQEQTLYSIEHGNVLFFPNLNFSLEEHERKFLSPNYVNKKAKNISYSLSNDDLRGALGSLEELHQLKTMLRRFSQQANQFIRLIFPYYSAQLQIARTSFRPVQVSNRKISYRKDDKRLHVDAFPATPNQGKRILRLFCNINPNGEDRVWRIGEPFEEVATRFLPQIPQPLPGTAFLMKLLRITKSYRTEYDHIMLQIHDRMKADENYQQQAKQIEMRFPPNSTWIVQTDQVSHAAMSGQFLLEQTFYLPVDAMYVPQQSPLKILEKLTGRTLI